MEYFWSMRTKRLQMILSLFIFLFAVGALADQSEYLHQPYISARVMGMGGAFTAVADDYNAMFYNPAGLSHVDHAQIIADFYGLVTPNIIGFYNDLSNAGSDPVKLQSVLTNNFGSHFASRVGLGGTWVHPNWGITVQPVDLTVEADVNAVNGASVGVQAYQDTLIQYGYSWVIGEDKALTIGIAPKVVYRGYVEKDEDILDLAQSQQLFKASDANEGFTVDGDIGLIYIIKPSEDGFFKFLQYAKPTLGFAVRNVVDSGFNTNFHLYDKNSQITTSKLERRFDVGTKFELPEFWKFFKPRIMIDGRDIGTRYASLIKCLHVGAEVLWKAYSWLNGGYRIGFSEGYLTGGVSAELGIFNLDLATYSEEIGTSDAPKESRRFMAELAIDF